MNRILLALAFFLSVSGCTKSGEVDRPVHQTTCSDTDAINFGAKANCEYVIDKIAGSYMVEVIEYQLQQDQVGIEFQMDVWDSYCPEYSNIHTSAELVTLNGSLFYPTSFCILLDGYKFHWDGYNPTWSDAYIAGEGNFENGQFTFTGNIYNSEGEFAIRLKSTSFHPKDK